MSQSGALNNLTPAPGTTLFLEADDGAQVPPNAGGVIFVVGGTNISTEGDVGTNTITINAGETPLDVTTVDATPTLIAFATIAAGSAVNVSCTFIAIQDTFASAIGGSAFSIVRNAGVGAVLVGGAGGHQNIIDDSNGFPGIDFAVLGNDIQIFVTGVAATTYNWRIVVSELTI